MSKSKLLAVAATFIMALAVSAPASATPGEAIQKAANATARAGEKAKDAVVHVAKVAASGVEYGANKAGQAVTRVARKLGLVNDNAVSADARAQSLRRSGNLGDSA